MPVISWGRAAPRWISTTISAGLPTKRGCTGMGTSHSDIDPRISDGLQDVHDRVDHDVAGAEQEGHAGDRGKVRDRTALGDVLAQTGPAEDLLDHGHPGEHQA